MKNALSALLVLVSSSAFAQVQVGDQVTYECEVPLTEVNGTKVVLIQTVQGIGHYTDGVKPWVESSFVYLDRAGRHIDASVSWNVGVLPDDATLQNLVEGCTPERTTYTVVKNLGNEALITVAGCRVDNPMGRSSAIGEVAQDTWAIGMNLPFPLAMTSMLDGQKNFVCRMTGFLKN